MVSSETFVVNCRSICEPHVSQPTRIRLAYTLPNPWSAPALLFENEIRYPIYNTEGVSYSQRLSLLFEVSGWKSRSVHFFSILCSRLFLEPHISDDLTTLTNLLCTFLRHIEHSLGLLPGFVSSYQVVTSRLGTSRFGDLIGYLIPNIKTTGTSGTSFNANKMTAGEWYV